MDINSESFKNKFHGNLINALPKKNINKIMTKVFDSDLSYPMETGKASEKSVVDCCTYINIAYSFLSSYDAEMFTRPSKTDLWALFNKVFFMPFEIPTICYSKFYM